MNKYVFLLIFSVFIFENPLMAKIKKPVRVLLLSGSNNHNWEKTTPQLEEIFSSSGLFSYSITLQPDTLREEDFQAFDVVLNNWNSWPENEVRWPEKTEDALTGFIKKGGGFVTFHASTSAFYEWPEFKKFSTAAWIMNQTKHGKNSATEVNIIDQKHPVTKGMTRFYIFDELWVNAEENPGFEVLGTATNEKLKEQGKPEQPAIMVSKYGKGRVFHTILGHDARAMRNTGFKQLLLRGTEWAATGKVTQSPAQELQPERESARYKWQETDTTFALLNGDHIVWQYNFKTKHGRPFFHPVFVDGNNMTCLSPDDHRWHLGQWFCWKYINKVNYWEYRRGPFQSDGVTEVKNVKIKKNDDYSAEIILDIVYYSFGGDNVLAEKRVVKVGSPQPDGKLGMDYDFEFEALADEVELNRTPVLGEPNGKSWGGYAGLSMRFSQDFMDSEFITPWNDNDSINGRQGDWLYMGFTGIDGEKVGTQIMVAPNSRRDGWAWYQVDSEAQPFYYFSPAYLYFQPLTLKRGEIIQLNYRVLHLPGDVNRQLLSEEFQKYKNQ